MSDKDLRKAVEAVVDRMTGREVDHRHPEEAGAAAPFAMGRAYYYAGDIIDDISDLRAALAGAASEESVCFHCGEALSERGGVLVHMTGPQASKVICALNPYGDFEATLPCSHCPRGCRSCWPPDCECYAHQSEPDRRLSGEMDADSTNSAP